MVDITKVTKVLEKIFETVTCTFLKFFSLWKIMKAKTWGVHIRTARFCDFFQWTRNVYQKTQKLANFCRKGVISRSKHFGEFFYVFHDSKSGNKLSLSRGGRFFNRLHRTCVTIMKKMSERRSANLPMFGSGKKVKILARKKPNLF